MARHYNVNNAYTTAELGPYPLFDLKTLMIAHGWTVTRSNDGTLFGAADYITTALKLTNRYSWMVLHNTGTGREWLFGRHNNTEYNEWYVGYSANVGGAAGFTGGTTTIMPTATDEVAVSGARTVGPFDLFPSYNCYCHMMVDDASDAFYLISVIQTNHLMVSCLAGDPLTQTHTLDTDPYVAIAQHYSYTSSFAAVTSGPWDASDPYCYTRGWYKYPASVGSAERIHAMCLATGYSPKPLSPATSSGGGGKNSYDQKDEIFPVIWGRSSYHPAPIGVKGVSTLFHNVSTQRFSGGLLTVGTEKMIMTGVSASQYNVSLPWHPTAIPW